MFFQDKIFEYDEASNSQTNQINSVADSQSQLRSACNISQQKSDNQYQSGQLQPSLFQSKQQFDSQPKISQKITNNQIACIFQEKTFIAMSYFDQQTQQVYLVKIIEESNEICENFNCFLKTFYANKQQGFGKILLQNGINTKTQSLILSFLNSNTIQLKGEQSQEDNNIIQIVNKNKVTALNAVTILLSLNFCEYNQNDYKIKNELNPFCVNDAQNKKLNIIKALFDIQDELKLKCVGTLLSFLLQNHLINGNQFSVSNIQQVNPQKIVQISKKSQLELQIFKEDIHPSTINGKGRSKEGFSLYTLYENCISTSFGQIRLKQWFTTPTYDLTVLDFRLQSVMQLDEILVKDKIKTLQKMMSKIFDVNKLINKFVELNGTFEDIAKFHDSLMASVQVINFMKDNTQVKSKQIKHDLISNIQQNNLDTANDVLDFISKIFDLPSLRNKNDHQQHHNYILPGVNHEYDNVKQILPNLEQLLQLQAQDTLRGSSQIKLNGINVHDGHAIKLEFFPQVGYVMKINIASAKKNQAQKQHQPNQQQQQLQTKGILKNSNKEAMLRVRNLSFTDAHQQHNHSNSNKQSLFGSGDLIMPPSTVSPASYCPLIPTNPNSSSNNVIKPNSFLTGNQLQIIEEELDEEKEESEEGLFSQYKQEGDPSASFQQSAIRTSSTTDNIHMSSITYNDVESKEEKIDQDQWDLQFQIEDAQYYKTGISRKFDEQYGDFPGKIINIERNILLEVQQQLGTYKLYIIELQSQLADLDCFLSYLTMARNHSLSPPILTVRNQFLIKDARHLLIQSLNQQNVIPNDYIVQNYIDTVEQGILLREQETSNVGGGGGSLINPEFSNKCCILTGANNSGKSVYLKTISLIIYLAHIGSYVPAAIAKIGLVDAIITQIRESDSITHNLQQSDMIDLQDVSCMLRQASNRSFVVIDELGKLAPPCIGQSLFATLTQYIANINKSNGDGGNAFTSFRTYKKGNNDFRNYMNQIRACINDATICNLPAFAVEQRMLYEEIPTFILTTHFKDMFNDKLVHQSYITRFITMDCRVIIQQNTQQKLMQEQKNELAPKYSNKDGMETIVYLYRVKPGFAAASYAIPLAYSSLHPEFQGIAKRAYQLLQDYKMGVQVGSDSQIHRMFKQIVLRQLTLLHANAKKQKFE